MRASKLRKPSTASNNNREEQFKTQGFQNISVRSLHGVIDGAPAALMLLNRDYDILTLNEKAQMTMQKFMKVIVEPGMNLLDTLPDFRKKIAKRELKKASLGNSINYEAEYPDKNWLWVSYYPLKDQQGKIKEICVALRDITGFKSIENRLRKREQLYRSLLDSLSEGVVYQSVDKKFVKCNKSAERILDIRQEQLAKSGFPLPGWKLYNQKKEAIDFAAFLSDDKLNCMPVRNFVLGIQKKKDIHWLSLNIEPVKDKSTGMHACLISFNDITEQERLNKDLKILLLAATKITNSVIVTNPNRQIVWANDAFTKNTGYTFEEVEGKVPGHFLQGKETDPQMIKYMRQQFQQNLPFECEIKNYKKTGEKFWMRISVQPLFNTDGSISGYLGVGTNITEQKKLQEKLIYHKIEQQKEITRATIAGQEKERNELGRELHDNINQILAATKIQLEYYRKSENKKPQCITTSLEYLDLAIQEIRTLSRQLVAPRFQETKLEDEINLVIETLELKEKTELEIKNFDKEQVSQDVKLTLFRIFQEQLSNIIKYSRAKSILVKLETRNNHAELLIKDDGVGFDTTQKRNGIGLNNVHNRVELHGGLAQIISAPGEGCRLQISIPLKKP